MGSSLSILRENWLMKAPRTTLLYCLAGMAAWLFTGLVSAQAFTTVIIDPGHGGHDLGAYEGLVYEKHLNMDVAKRLERTLRQAGFRTVITRDRDEFIPLADRAEISNRYRNAIFISIHFNSSYKSRVTGIETYYRSSDSRNLAAYVQTELIRNLGGLDRGVKTANFAVLRRNRNPSVLVEGGFVSNTGERDKMLDPRYRQVVADSIARAIVRYHKS